VGLGTTSCGVVQLPPPTHSVKPRSRQSDRGFVVSLAALPGRPLWAHQTSGCRTGYGHRVMRRMTTAAATVAVAALLLAGCSATGNGEDDGHGRGTGIEGYVEPGDGAADRVWTAVDRGADVIGVDGAALSDDGTHLLPTSGDVGELVGVAAKAGARTEVLFSNYSATIGDFSPEAATALLSSSDNRAGVVGELVDLAARLGTDGVQIDLESMRSQDQADLVTLTRALRSAVPEPLADDAEVSIAMMSSTDPARS
jgi:spore germination protein